MSNKAWYTWIPVVIAALVLVGCASSPAGDSSSRYRISQDRAPSGNFDASGLPDALPVYEAPSSAGNKSPYTVWGERYEVMDSNEGYVARGIASWYGEKFHGHKTSNGEVFNMYAMSAAHRSLRIPGYARVTNLENGRSVVVRVNDRGPFHSERLMDLSYAAAKKLGFHDRGTARVEVAAITVHPDGSMWLAGRPYTPGADGNQTASRTSVSPQPAGDSRGLFVQLGSFSSREPAEKLLSRAQAVLENPVRVREVDTASGRFHRVQVGPFATEEGARQTQYLLETRGFSQSILLTDTH